MRNEVIKICALLVLLLFSTCVDSIPEEGKKVVIVLPYYKHEVQGIYFKDPSSSAGPPNQEQYTNYLSSKPMGIKVWVEKRPSADRGKTNGFPYNFNSNDGVGFSGIQVQGNRPMNNAWPGNQEQWPRNPGTQQGFSGNQPGFSGNEPPRPATQPGFSGNQSPWSGGNQLGFSGGNQPGFSENQPPRPQGTQAGFSGNPPPWSGGNQPGVSGGNRPGFPGNGPPRPGTQPGFSGNQSPWSEGNRPGFPGNGPPRPRTQPGFSGNQSPWAEGNRPGFSGNGPPRPGTQPGFSGNQSPWAEGNRPGFSGNGPPRPGTQPGFSGNQSPWAGGNRPGFSGNGPPRPGTQPGFSGNQPLWSEGNQPGFSGNEPLGSQGTQPGFSGNQPLWSEGNQPGLSGNEPLWSESQPGVPDNNFQAPRFEGNSYNKYPNGDVTRPTDSYSSSWSSIKVFPGNQGKSLQMSTHFNAPNSRWPASGAGKNAQGWNIGWKGDRPQQGSNQQPPDNSFLGGKPQWEGQGGRYLPAGDDEWQPIAPPGSNEGWQSQRNQPGRPPNGNGDVWGRDTNTRETDNPGGRWETQTQQEWEKNQQGSTGNDFSPPESVTWRDERVVLDQQRWPKTTATAPAQGWSAANEVNDGLRGGCPPGVGGNNCFRGVRDGNNHQDGYASEKPGDGGIGGWNEPLPNGGGNAVNNYEEISFKSRKPQENYLQGENSYGGSGYANKGNQVKNAQNNLNALGFNNYRSRESQGVSSNFAPGDNRSNRNGKHESSDDAEIYVGQDSYGVLINHGNSDFYRNSRNTDVVSGGKFPVVDSYSSATFGGVKTRVKSTVSDKEKRGNSTDVNVEFGKKLKDGTKKLKKASVDDLSTS